MEFNIYTVDKKSTFSIAFNILKDGELIYKATPKGVFSKHYELSNSSGIFMVIKRSTSMLTYEFEIFRDNQILAVAKSGSVLSGITMNVTSQVGEWKITGDWKGKETTLIRDNDEIAKISRNPWSTKNYLGVAIKTDEDDELILALVITLEYLRLAQTGAA